MNVTEAGYFFAGGGFVLAWLGLSAVCYWVFTRWGINLIPFGCPMPLPHHFPVPPPPEPPGRKHFIIDA